MNAQHLKQSPSYVTSTVHALGITFWALSKVSSSFFCCPFFLSHYAQISSKTNGGECRNVIPFTLGYFINDFFQECGK